MEKEKYSIKDIPLELLSNIVFTIIGYAILGLFFCIIVKNVKTLLYAGIVLTSIIVMSKAYIIYSALKGNVLVYEGTVEELNSPVFHARIPKGFKALGFNDLHLLGESTLLLKLSDGNKLLVSVNQGFKPSKDGIIHVYTTGSDVFIKNNNTIQINNPILVCETKS